MKNYTYLLIGGAIAIIGLTFLFVLNWNITGMLPYRDVVCSRAIPDSSLPTALCLRQAQEACAEIHPPYISPTSKFNTCYNTCVLHAQSLCYK